MSQLHLNASNESTVYPFFCGNSACLTHHGAKIALGETHLRGIECHVVFLHGMLIDKVDEAVEDCLLMRFQSLLLIGITAEERVVMMHLCRYKAAYKCAVVVMLVNNMPESVDDLKGGGDISF